MHKSVIEFFIRNILPAEVSGRTILEAGSLEVNGSVKPYFMRCHPDEYIGIDMVPGLGVDFCTKIEDFQSPPFDIVVSTETLEHAEDWRATVNAIKNLCKPDGLLFITTRSPGFWRHCYPNDYWRYTQEDLKQIFADCEILVLEDDPQTTPIPHPGVFMKARKPSNFTPCALDSIELTAAPTE
jgi:SAM-dependent methyltransferase